MRPDRVQDLGLVFRKKLSANELQSEALVTAAAHSVSLLSDFYYVPKVLEVDQDRGLLVLEFVPNAVPISRFLNTDREAIVLSSAARALAHAHLRLTSLLQEGCREKNGWPSGAVVIHGDYNLTNVCLQAPQMRLVIFDWNVPPMYRRTSIWGLPEYDVACLIRAAVLSAPLRAFECKGHRRTQIIIQGYETERSGGLDRARLSAQFRDVVVRGAWRQLRQFKWLSLLKSLYAMLRFARVENWVRTRGNEV